MKNKLKVLGVIPARLSASRFPNKPLKKIINLTMLEHVYERSKLAKNLIILQLPLVIRKFLIFQKKNYNVIMTSKNMFVHLIGFMRHQKN